MLEEIFEVFVLVIVAITLLFLVSFVVFLPLWIALIIMYLKHITIDSDILLILILVSTLWYAIIKALTEED